MSQYYICIDLGTSKIKCALINEDGEFVYFSKRDAKTYYGQIIYQNPDEYLNIVLEEIRNLKHCYPDNFKKAAFLIISGQMGGILGVDENLDVVFPWTYSVDTKYNGHLFNLEKNYKKKIRESSGGTPTMAAKIGWIQDKFPEKCRKIKKFLNLMSYVVCKLCGLSIPQTFIDCSCLTMSGIADIRNLSWNEELCNEFNIDIKKMPQIKKANEIIGIIDRKIFETETEIIVLAGCGDQVAGFLGAGVNLENDLIDVSGTYTILGYCTNKYIADTKFDTIHSIYSGISDIHYQIAILTAGGYTFDWFFKNFKYNNEKIKNNCIDSNKEKIFFIPHFGGRYSPSQPYFRGGWIGVTWEHDINDLYNAILESSGYEFYYAINTIQKLNNLKLNELKPIKVIGGGSSNDFENEIKANILNLKYFRLNNIAYELLGSFLIAKYGDNIRDGYKKLIKNGIVKIEREYVPSEPKLKYYESFKEKYAKIIKKMDELYAEINPVA